MNINYNQFEPIVGIINNKTDKKVKINTYDAIKTMIMEQRQGIQEIQEDKKPIKKNSKTKKDNYIKIL